MPVNQLVNSFIFNDYVIGITVFFINPTYLEGMEFKGKNGEFIQMVEIGADNCHLLNEYKESELSLLWFNTEGNVLKIDSVEYDIKKNQLIALTEFHKIEPVSIQGLCLIKWNRGFYCVVNHDTEVSCKGILYYGASNVPVISPSEEDLDILETVLKMFMIEMNSKDNFQQEMLQMMLKRLIILCTRIYKTHNIKLDTKENIDIIRDYNYLVEQHFREKHNVADYADLMNKSPKTLSNLFKKQGEISPLKFIQNRIILEAKRLLDHSDLMVSEIMYDLGYSDIQAFSRFFKGQVGCSPQNYREGKK